VLVEDTNGGVYYGFTSGNEEELSVTDVQVKQEGGVRVSWETNLQAKGTVFYRLKGSNEWLSQEEHVFSTTHELTLPLTQGEYEFYLNCEDMSGEQSAADDNQGAYYSVSLVEADGPWAGESSAGPSSLLIIPCVAAGFVLILFGVLKTGFLRPEDITGEGVFKGTLTAVFSRPQMMIRRARRLRMEACPKCGRLTLSTQSPPNCRLCGKSGK